MVAAILEIMELACPRRHAQRLVAITPALPWVTPERPAEQLLAAQRPARQLLALQLLDRDPPLVSVRALVPALCEFFVLRFEVGLIVLQV